ncbi:tRNA uridine-5-carboxymethylaminomethyl(34) synthesis GTPase MnmE [Candidatus Profftia tarda]|nr:tRNA uridine-5-carboxymethylaminomethyl(34) synthesis GTPase MnmE [Candidatus Profftia tarda]
MSQYDTIIAQATPPGRGGIGIIRASGIQAKAIAIACLGKLPEPRYAEYLPFKDANGILLDKGIALYFPAPNSFTGEDVLELQAHGGPIILDMLLKSSLKIQDVRIAYPGEFSQRAFLNSKLDLAQAEGIADLIDASSEQAARSALHSLQGVFSRKVNKLVEAITHVRIYIEAVINFPDEDVDSVPIGKLEAQLNSIIEELQVILAEARQGILLREGLKVVITGRPNAGKSSLLNALTGQDTAIVTNIAGTTRDVLREHILIDDMPLHIVDTAGLCETHQEIERIGIERAWSEIRQADHILCMIDATTTDEIASTTIWPDVMDQLPKNLPITIIKNKVDLTGESVGVSSVNSYSVIRLSALTGEGLDMLRVHLRKIIGLDNIEGKFLARRRHLHALGIAAEHLERGKDQLCNTNAIELLAEELHLAQQALNEITGKFTSDELLGRIFSSFCLGK